MKTISVGELRQNPASMIADVEAGEVYELARAFESFVKSQFGLSPGKMRAV